MYFVILLGLKQLMNILGKEGNKIITEIDLRDNRLDDECADIIIETLKDNKIIRSM